MLSATSYLSGQTGCTPATEEKLLTCIILGAYGPEIFHEAFDLLIAAYK